MNLKYKLTYHLAAGIAVNVDNVSLEDMEAMENVLRDDHGVIVVRNGSTPKRQFIPVRNILAVEVDEAGDGR